MLVWMFANAIRCGKELDSPSLPNCIALRMWGERAQRYFPHCEERVTRWSASYGYRGTSSWTCWLSALLALLNSCIWRMVVFEEFYFIWDSGLSELVRIHSLSYWARASSFCNPRIRFFLIFLILLYFLWPCCQSTEFFLFWLALYLYLIPLQACGRIIVLIDQGAWSEVSRIKNI